MTDLRVRFGFTLAVAMFPILLFAIYMAYSDGRVLLVLVSILAWVFAYSSLWISTDKFVFSHLREIKSASDRFATGDLDARVGDMPKAPSRIAELAHAFDDMADNISDRESRLVDNLDEKETLLREIHHRVKNNLQIIISLLNMQERKLADTDGLAAIQETRGRINAIALVHRGLYEGEDLRVINMPVFLGRLVNELKIGWGSGRQNLTITTHIDDTSFDPDTAIAVALFIVEALTNAMKHGVSDGGNVVVSLKKAQETINISVSDDGPGLPKSVKSGTGSKLMKGFARQLSGTLNNASSSHGYATSLSFDL
jgi:two-component sensor histidine kinase